MEKSGLLIYNILINYINNKKFNLLFSNYFMKNKI